ncbi:MAG: hypothetical protein ACRELB_03125, partial [Polyangiaceae bacterium]
VIPLRVHLVRALLASPLLALGCTSALGVQDLPGDSCGGATFTSGCDLCIAASCCLELQQCSADSSCGSGLLTCAAGCNGSSSCLSACGNEFPSAVAEYNGLIACMNTSCPSSCGGGS